MNSNLMLFLIWNRIMNPHCDVFINQNHWSGKQYRLKSQLERDSSVDALIKNISVSLILVKFVSAYV